MFQLGATTKIYLAAGVTDMRKSFDTLSGIVRSWRQEDTTSTAEQIDPLSGHLFVFCNRRRDRIKVLYFDGSGLWVCAKRLERGTFSWPEAVGTSMTSKKKQASKVVIDQHEFALLLGGVDLCQTKKRSWWRRPVATDC